MPSLIIVVDPVYLNQIKAFAGWPTIDSVLLDDEQVRQIALFPAMMEYFSKWPIQEKVQYDGVSEASYPFPDDYTFGLMDIRAVGKVEQEGSGSTDFLSLLRYNSNYSGSVLKSVGRYGRRSLRRTAYSPEGLRFQYLQNNQLMSSLSEEGTIKYTLDRQNKKVDVYVSSTCSIMISWAKFSNIFEDVMFSQKRNVIKLAGANLLRHIADVGSLMEDDNLEKKFNVSELKDRSETMRTEVMDLWKEMPNPFIFRLS